MKEKRMLYFAYGSNMNHDQMRHRCKGAKFIAKAYLENYAFVYDGYSSARYGAVANIIPEEGIVVWGGLWEIGDDDLTRLDSYEGYPFSYDRKDVVVKDEAGREYHAFLYFRKHRNPGTPSDYYRSVVIEGARDCGLSEDYIDENL